MTLYTRSAWNSALSQLRTRHTLAVITIVIVVLLVVDHLGEAAGVPACQVMMGKGCHKQRGQLSQGHWSGQQQGWNAQKRR